MLDAILTSAMLMTSKRRQKEEYMKTHERSSLTLRLPKELKDWLNAKARENFTSQNDEVIRCIIEKQQKEKAEALPTA